MISRAVLRSDLSSFAQHGSALFLTSCSLAQEQPSPTMPLPRGLVRHDVEEAYPRVLADVSCGQKTGE